MNQNDAPSSPSPATTAVASASSTTPAIGGAASLLAASPALPAAAITDVGQVARATAAANERWIYVVLISGFLLQLFLIFWQGRFAAHKLSELRLEADELARDYTIRLQQAVAISAASEVVIAEARLDRASRAALNFRALPFRNSAAAANARLQKLLTEGKQLYQQRKTGLPPAELATWHEVEEAANEFWQVVEEERQRAITSEEKPNAMGTPSGEPTPVAPLTTDDQTQQRTDFYASRSRLSKAVEKHSHLLVQGRGTMLDNIQARQQSAAESVSTVRWITFWVALVLALLTLYVVYQAFKRFRLARRAAEEASGLTTSVLNSLHDDVLAVNEDGAVLTTNPAFLKDFGFTQREAIQQDYRTLLSRAPEIRRFIEQATQSTAGPSARQTARIEVEPATAAYQPQAQAISERRIFDAEIAPRLVSTTEQRGHVVVLTDITETERNREETERSRRLSAIGQLTQQIAHEIYNPLGTIKLNADLLEMQLQERDEDVRGTVARLKRGLERLNTIILDLRYLARPREPERKPTELNAVLEDVIELASERLERTQIRVVREFSAQPLTGEYDAMQLGKVFLNLLINAIEASPQAGQIALRTRAIKPDELPADFSPARSAFAISVIDHGTGMSAETKRRVFEAFYSTKQNGTGLGMMITQEIIKKHGGLIDVQSEQGKGTTVTVYLPQQ